MNAYKRFKICRNLNFKNLRELCLLVPINLNYGAKKLFRLTPVAASTSLYKGGEQQGSGWLAIIVPFISEPGLPKHD